MKPFCHLLACLTLSVLIPNNSARKHHLTVRKDTRRSIPLSTFGFYDGGELSVNLTGFQIDHEDATVGFSIDRTVSDARNPYVETIDTECILNKKLGERDKAGILRFILNLKESKTKVKCSKNMQKEVPFIINHLKEEKESHLKDSSLFGGRSPANQKESDMIEDIMKQRAKRADSTESGEEQKKGKENENEKEKVPTGGIEVKKKDSELEDPCSKIEIPIVRYNADGREYFKTSFVINILGDQEGLYSMYFHNCYDPPNHNNERDHVNFTIDIVEKNGESYLSAGQMPLPSLYQILSITFFLSGCFWVFILRKNGAEQVYRIHWIMAALLFLKSLSLFFHGVNYHMIATNGYHIETWAVLYYITHLLKGGLLFFTIVLIGSGWAFIKHILSSKEKRVFMIVLPLQVLANVAYIIVEESEQGEQVHHFWKEVFILVDLVCCGAILLPVVWSIRHLQEASSTDGKAAVSLEKLKLFRHFYIMVVCYVYFTRIIVYLLKITVPFRYEWLDELFKETATFVFFIMTGYKFRPASDNPYFSVPTDDYDVEEILVGSTSIQEQVKSRKNRVLENDDDYDDDDDDETVVLFSKSESSHDLD